MGFCCGFVGLPNVGKSTLFQALTSIAIARANYPFTTIDPNVGKVDVPDGRLKELAELVHPEKIISTQMEFVDIAGLVEGAHKGEGLGNQFLSHIQAVDAVVHVLRCFEDGEIVHVSGNVDPVRDFSLIETELIMKDFEIVDRKLSSVQKQAKSGDKEKIKEAEILTRIHKTLGEGKIASGFQEELDEMDPLGLLTAKPYLFLCNLSEEPSEEELKSLASLQALSRERGVPCISVRGQAEAEIASLDIEERGEFLRELGMEKSGLETLIEAGYQLLNYITFFTAGPQEVRAWTVHRNAFAPQAAGKVHSDMEKGFIRAEVIGFDDFIVCKGEAGARTAGKLRLEGKEYPVKDGDIMHFRFNV